MTTWPENKRFALTLSFDLDAETAWEPSSLNGRRLSLLSMGAYGRRVGVPRILELLARYGIRAQFYIPARVAEIDPDVVRSIARALRGDDAVSDNELAEILKQWAELLALGPRLFRALAANNLRHGGQGLQPTALDELQRGAA